MVVYYKVKGTADDYYSAGEISAKDEKAAMKQLKKIYGDNDLVEIEIVEQHEFDQLQQKNGHKLTHKPGK